MVAAAILKHVRPDFLPFVRIGGTVIAGLLAVGIVSPIIAYLDSLFNGTGFGEWGGSVMKALGIAVLVQICSDVCRDSGEGGLASGIEVIGKIEIVILCLPMMERIVSIAKEVLSW